MDLFHKDTVSQRYYADILRHLREHIWQNQP